MLVCNVSLRPPRAAIAATIAETVTAADAATIEGAILAALVDDPAAVTDAVDAYLGEIMVEAASASDTVEAAGAVLTGAVDEAGTATDIPDATVVGAIVSMDAMLPGVFVNSDGTSRQANVDGVMVNL